VPATQRLLATDLDGTVIPTPQGGAGGDGGRRDGGTDAFREAFERPARARRGVVLAYVTGRHLSFALEGVAGAGLPGPDLLACDVGTSLYRPDEGAWSPDPERWRADPDYRASMRAAMGGVDTGEIRRALAGTADLLPQEDEKQAEFKVSWYAPAPPRLDGVVDAMRERLASVAPVELVASVDPSTGRGLIDVLPSGVAKDRALGFMRAELEVGPDATLYAGDSGNDRAALLSGVLAVLVGNAPRTLADELRREARGRGLGERLYLATAPFAHGVLEGCEHFGV
jgi:HAD superfamily hydrolase (TIGR01484 family)